MAVEALIPPAASKVRKLDLRVVIGILLMLFAIAANASLIRKAQDRIPVLVAAKPVQPGEVIAAEDLRTSWISASGGIDFVQESDRALIIGQVAAEPLSPGKLINPKSVAKGASLPIGFVAMSIALKPELAAGGDLRSGDRVSVIASTSPDRPEARTTILLRDIEVLSSRRAQSTEGSGVLVVLKLRLEEARGIAEAQSAGTVSLVLQSSATEQTGAGE